MSAPARVPRTAAEEREHLRLIEAGDPLAISRWEYPGCRYLLVEHHDSGYRFIIAVPPGAQPIELPEGGEFAAHLAVSLEADVTHIVRLPHDSAGSRPAA